MAGKLNGSNEALCVLCGERPAEVGVSFYNKSEPQVGFMARYKLCPECSSSERSAVRLLVRCDEHASAEQYRASRPAAEQLRLLD